MRPPHAALPLALVLLAATLAGAAGAAPATGGPPASAPPGSASTAASPSTTLQDGNGTLGDPDVRIGIQLRSGGDARFTVSMAFPLDGERDRAAFRRLAEDFEAGDADLTLGMDAFRRASERANETTDRAMSVGTVDRTATTRNGTGVLRLSFTWSNFATTGGDRYRVGSAFNTTDGTWLPGLAEGQMLVVRPPEGYAVRSAPIGHPNSALTNSTLRITGPATFEPGFLQLTYRQTDPATTTPPDDDRSAFVFAGALLFALVALALVVYALRRRSDDAGAAGAPAAGDGAGAPVEGGAVPADAGVSGGAAAGAGEAVDDESEEAGDEVDLDLLSDEERVEHLLRQNGGRMKQANIVKETGWSNAKVSQLLSSMADEDRVKKLRIGRENLIALPDEDIGEFES